MLAVDCVSGTEGFTMLTIFERARRYSAKCPPSISGMRGHDAAFHTAAVLWHGFGLSEADTLTLLREWNTGCVPPWNESELVHKVRSVASAQHRNGRGHLLGENIENFANGSDSSALVAKAEKMVRPAFGPMVLKRIAAKVQIADVVAFLSERSPVRVGTQDSGSVLRQLYTFGSGEKVLVF